MDSNLEAQYEEDMKPAFLNNYIEEQAEDVKPVLTMNVDTHVQISSELNTAVKVESDLLESKVQSLHHEEDIKPEFLDELIEQPNDETKQSKVTELIKSDESIRNPEELVCFDDFKEEDLQSEEAKRLWRIANKQINKLRSTIRALRIQNGRLMNNMIENDDEESLGTSPDVEEATQAVIGEFLPAKSRESKKQKMEESAVCTPLEMREEAASVALNLLPEKSKDFYMKVYSMFKDWCQSKGVSHVSENVLLVYFEEKAEGRKASSLWAIFSMLKQTLKLRENIDISKYYKVISFLRRKYDTYTAKKAAVFEQKDVTKFITEAPDEIFLSTKAVFVIALAGACRTDELCNMKVADVDVREDIIIISIPHTKNKSKRKFVILQPLWIDVVKKYLSRRPSPDMEKLFIGFRCGKPTRQNMGHNTISRVPAKIATYLKLKNPNEFTGHALRRTSATILANNGGDMLTLESRGGWKSSTAEGCVEHSLAEKKAYR